MTMRIKTVYTCLLIGDGLLKTKQSPCLQQMCHELAPLKLGQCQDHEAAKPMCIPWGSKISRGCIQEAWIYPASDFDSTSTSGSVKRCSLFPATTACRRVPGEWLDTPKLLGASMATTSMASIGIAAGVLRCPYDSVWFNTYCVLMFLA